MSPRCSLALGLILLAMAAAPASASAAFGFLPGGDGFDAALVERDGSPALVAGSHPYALDIALGLNRVGQRADGDLRDLRLRMPPSLLLNPAAVPECASAQFHSPRQSPFQQSLSGESCPDDSQVGVVAVHSDYEGGTTRHFGVFNLTPPLGSVSAIGFAPFGVPIVLSGSIGAADTAVTLDLEDLPQAVSIHGLDLTLWGTPWAEPVGESWAFPHDDERGDCLNEVDPESPFGERSIFIPGSSGQPSVYIPGTCAGGGDPSMTSPRSHLTLPTACDGALPFAASASSWQGATATASASGPALENCRPPLPTALVQLTTQDAASPTGLAFQLDLAAGGGVFNPRGIARPPIRRAVLALPEGLTINPSVGAGLGVCTAAELARETASSAPGAGCPNASKIGEIAVDGLIGVPEAVRGAVFLAEPYANPYGSLIAVYLVASSPRRGLLLKSTGKVETDARSGRMLATFDDLPQLPYTRFALRFREGQRAVMVSPPQCGSFPATLELTPWSEPGASARSTSTIAITRGERGGACPGGSLPPFDPQLTAGSLNPTAGAFSPFYLHMTRTDADQELTSYSAQFPPGLLASLTGVATCSDAAIAAATGKSAAEEETSPSCPVQSRIGRSIVGEGVGQTLAYAPGAFYLAGPYNGAPLSVAAITAARVGPFDLGTIVVRFAIRIDPRTAQASLDPSGSDRIPHIIRGIPIHVRDIRVYIDLPGFTLNPTSCDPFSVGSTMTGAGLDVFSAADDVAVTADDRFQVFDCKALAFAPKLSLRIKGKRRGQYPALRAVLRQPPRSANIRSAAVSLPPSLFLAQEHIDLICTASEFRTQTCPRRSMYGRARAFTPLLDDPLEGPVYLRASPHRLPELVASLRGRGIATEVVGRIDSPRGNLRASFESLPDAPVSKFVMNVFGGKRGLLVNAENGCSRRWSAGVRMIGHNNKVHYLRPQLKANCGGKR